MKIIHSTSVLAAVCIFFYSCNKTHKEENANQFLFGTWKVVKVGFDNNHNGSPEENEFTETNVPFNHHVMVLSTDFTGVISYRPEHEYDTVGSADIKKPFTWRPFFKQIWIQETSGKQDDYYFQFYSISANELVRKEILYYSPPTYTWYVYHRQ